MFTHNNYLSTALEDTIECEYIAYGHEIAPTTGTPHLQGFIHFKNAKTKSAVIKLMPGCHIEVMMGSIEENVHYCNKDGLFIERGDKPLANDNKGRAEKLRWQRTWELAKLGELESIDADIRIRQYNTLKRIAKDFMSKPPNLNGTCGIWIYGTSGVGKSHCVINRYPDRYIKPLNKWWDGYQNETIIHLDEICPTHTQWITPYLKKWADQWAFDAEIKGGALQIRPQRIIITSNYSIDAMGFAPEDIDAIKRRYIEIRKLSRDQEIYL